MYESHRTPAALRQMRRTTGIGERARRSPQVAQAVRPLLRRGKANVEACLTVVGFWLGWCVSLSGFSPAECNAHLPRTGRHGPWTGRTDGWPQRPDSSADPLTHTEPPDRPGTWRRRPPTPVRRPIDEDLLATGLRALATTVSGLAITVPILVGHRVCYARPPDDVKRRHMCDVKRRVLGDRLVESIHWENARPIRGRSQCESRTFDSAWPRS